MKLLEPFQFGAHTLQNRMVMAAMTRSRADNSGVVGAMTAEYYAQRATAGLILSEAINISADALGSPLPPGIFTETQIAAWQKSSLPYTPKAASFTPNSGIPAASPIP